MSFNLKKINDSDIKNNISLIIRIENFMKNTPILNVIYKLIQIPVVSFYILLGLINQRLNFL